MANSFQLTLDTLAPDLTGKLVTSLGDNTYTNKNFTFSLPDVSTVDVPYICFWTTDKASYTDEEYTAEVNDSAKTWTTRASTTETYTVKLPSTADGSYYLYVIGKDSVNNITVNGKYARFNFTKDTTKPSISEFFLSTDDTKENYPTSSVEYSTKAKIYVAFKATDTTLIHSYAINWGDGATQEVTLGTATNSITIPTVDTTGDDYSHTYTSDRTYTVTVTVTDKAGNTSVAATKSITIDTHPASLTLSLWKSDLSITGIWSNYSSFIARLTTNDADITGYEYKCWVGDKTSGDGLSWTSFETAVNKGDHWDLDVTKEQSTEGTTTVWASLKDAAGNITTTSAVTSYDKTAPVISNISRISKATEESTDFISDKAATNIVTGLTGYNKVTVSATVTDNLAGFTGSGIAAGGVKLSWVYSAGETPVTKTVDMTKGTGNTYSYTLTGGVDSLNIGENVFTIIATDVANNIKNSDTFILYYLPEDATQMGVSLSSTDPIGKKNTLDYDCYNSKFIAKLTLTKNGGAPDILKPVAYKAWQDLNESSATPAAGTTSYEHTEYTSATPLSIGIGNTNWVTESSAGTVAYWHFAISDKAGNVTIYNYQYYLDTVAPTFSLAFTQNIYTSTSATLKLTGVTEIGSGIATYKITGNVSQKEGNWAEGTVEIPVTLINEGTASQTRSVTLTLTDYAGNTTSNTASCQLDMDDPTIAVKFIDEGGTEINDGAYVKVPKFKIKLKITDDKSGGTGNVGYMVYGDFSETAGTGTTPVPESYTPFNSAGADSEGYITLPSSGYYYFTAGSAQAGAQFEKTCTISIKAKDDAGRTTEVSREIIYDTKPLTIEITNGPDYHIISKVNMLRPGSTNKYSDQVIVTFNIKNDQVISGCKQYKLCAYESIAAAKSETDIAGKAAIPTTNGSSNMSGSNHLKNENGITSVIYGADFEAALREAMSTSGTVDGARVVVIYAQDEAGNWSGVTTLEI